jgi:hypothetical protein
MQVNSEDKCQKNVPWCLVGFLIIYKPCYVSCDEKGTEN